MAMSDASVGRRWDLAVIGAGPAGSVCAYCALMACPGLRVALVDRETFPRDKACGDAVREEAMLTLSELGLGAPFADRPPVPRRQATVPRRFTYMKQMLKGNNRIYVVERQVLDHHLFEAAIDRGAADFSGHKLTDARVDENSEDWVLALKQSSGATVEVRCATLVGADGAGSRVRRIAGLELSGDRYTSVALRGYARVEGSAARAMRFDFLESVLPGYGWTFPLTGNAVNVGVIIDRMIYKLAERSLKSYLEEYVRWLRGEGVALTDLGPVMAHPLPLGSELPPLIPRGRHGVDRRRGLHDPSVHRRGHSLRNLGWARIGDPCRPKRRAGHAGSGGPGVFR